MRVLNSSVDSGSNTETVKLFLLDSNLAFRPTAFFSASLPTAGGFPTRHVAGRLAPTLYQPWQLSALCFAGFRLAALAAGAHCSFVSLIDAPGMKMERRSVAFLVCCFWRFFALTPLCHWKRITLFRENFGGL